jgi:hypothetical protein
MPWSRWIAGSHEPCDAASAERADRLASAADRGQGAVSALGQPHEQRDRDRDRPDAERDVQRAVGGVAQGHRRRGRKRAARHERRRIDAGH